MGETTGIQSKESAYKKMKIASILRSCYVNWFPDGILVHYAMQNKYYVRIGCVQIPAIKSHQDNISYNGASTMQE